jgi:lipopolysaccharide export system protein LptA
MIIRRAALLFALLIAPAVGGGASAQQATPPKHNSNAPVDFDADHMEVHDLDHRAFLTGSVRAVQQDMTLTADRVTANYSGTMANSNAQIHRMDANGHVVVTRPTEVAHGDYGIYDVDKRLVTLIGKVTLDRTGPNASTVRGGRLVINLDTNQATMDGGLVGKGNSGQGGRVSGRFTVPQHNDDSNAAGSTPAASSKTKPAGK